MGVDRSCVYGDGDASRSNVRIITLDVQAEDNEHLLLSMSCPPKLRGTQYRTFVLSEEMTYL